jgi:hypothetical protein
MKTYGWHERLAKSTNQSYDEPYRASSVYRRNVGSVVELPYAALGSQVLSQKTETKQRKVVIEQLDAEMSPPNDHI